MRKLVVSGVLLFLSASASAQWMTQTVALEEGWNSVYLQVHPPDSACAVVFADQPIEVVSWWCRDESVLGEFGENPEEPLPPEPDMLSWYPDNSAASTFHNMIGGESYLIQATAATTLTLTGVPAMPNDKIILGWPNLLGMNVPLLGNVMLSEYFAFFLEHLGDVPYATVRSDGTTQSRPGTYQAQTGQALWVTTVGEGTAEYAGPFNVSIDSAAAIMQFSGVLAPRTLRVKNNANFARTVHIGRIISENPPAGQGELAGQVPLMRAVIDWSAGYPRKTYEEVDFPWTADIDAGDTLELKMIPDIAAMPAAPGAYQSILVVSDRGSPDNHPDLVEGRCRYYVGVRAEGDLAEQTQPTGLWIGNVVLDTVNRAKMLTGAEGTWDPEALQAAPHPFAFRVILHVDEYGQTRLLKEVFIASVPQGLPNEGNTLLAEREVAETFRTQNPSAVIRRISSANFPFMRPLTLDGGGFAAAEAELVGEFILPYDDRVNPFVHAFHPDHDNREFLNSELVAKGDGAAGTGDYESWSVTRKVNFTFAANDPIGANPAWNLSVTGGTYKENIIGLGKTDIITAGVFRLTKVSDIPRILYVSGPESFE